MDESMKMILNHEKELAKLETIPRQIECLSESMRNMNKTMIEHTDKIVAAINDVKISLSDHEGKINLLSSEVISTKTNGKEKNRRTEESLEKEVISLKKRIDEKIEFVHDQVESRLNVISEAGKDNFARLALLFMVVLQLLLSLIPKLLGGIK